MFFVFAPALIFGSLVKIITFQEIISWQVFFCFLAFTQKNQESNDLVNLCQVVYARQHWIYVLGRGSLGWVAVKILRPEPHLASKALSSPTALRVY